MTNPNTAPSAASPDSHGDAQSRGLALLAKAKAQVAASEQARAEAFDNTFHKIKAEVSRDWWNRIWNMACVWQRCYTISTRDAGGAAPSADSDGSAEKADMAVIGYVVGYERTLLDKPVAGSQPVYAKLKGGRGEAVAPEAKPNWNERGHLAHCFQGEYLHSCKYGDDECPAAPSADSDGGADQVSQLCQDGCAEQALGGAACGKKCVVQSEAVAPEARADVLKQLRAAMDVVSALCDGSMRWTMSVPARPDSDPDLVISSALHAAEKLIAIALPAPPAPLPVTDSHLENLIDQSGGAWHEDIFHIDAADLMAMLRAAALSSPPALEAAPADQREHDYAILQQFHTRHALGALSAPSCLCCGASTQGREVAIQHGELPAIVICKKCRDAALSAQAAPEYRTGFDEAPSTFNAQDAAPADYPPLPEPATCALVEGNAMQGSEYRSLSQDWDETTARFSDRHMRAYVDADRRERVSSDYPPPSDVVSKEQALETLLADLREKCAATAEDTICAYVADREYYGEKAADRIRAIELDVAVRRFIEQSGRERVSADPLPDHALQNVWRGIYKALDKHAPGWCINRAPGVTIAQALVLAVEKLAASQHQVKKGEPS